MLPRLVAGLPPEEVAQVSADGADDQRPCYAAIWAVAAKAALPPRCGAKIWPHGNTKAARHLRDENRRTIRKKGKKKWQEESDYHQRSLAETSVFRYKASCGAHLRTRTLANQFNEMLIKCALLNRLTHLGRPDSYKVTGGKKVFQSRTRHLCNNAVAPHNFIAAIPLTQ